MARVRLPSWIVWPAILALATVVLRAQRLDLDAVHVVLVYLLIVLGSSVSGGRALGLVMTVTCVMLIDYYFQAPYDALSVTKPLDLIVLLAFLTTAGVATQLLARERARAAEAELRASEVASLARLGAEVLSSGRADDALLHIATVIRSSLDLTECRIYGWREATIRLLAASPEEPTADAPKAPDVHTLRDLVEQSDRDRTDDGTDATGLEPYGADPRTLVTVLRAHRRAVGVLWLAHVTSAAPGRTDRRFVGALAYYAALAVERAQLVAAAEHADALSEANRLKDVLLASVSHDLRTPLTTIKALAQRASRGGAPYALEIEEQADRLGHFVADLLDLSRLKSGGLTMHTDLNTAEDLVGAVLRQVRGVAGDRQIETRVDFSEPALVGRFDFVQSLRILGNLLENAVRYAPPPAPIELGVRRDAGALVFAVSDGGPGVPPSERERIFEPFYRPPGVVADGGAGLGLAIARELAERQGGTVTFTPHPGGGSVFELRLPATEVPLADGGTAPPVLPETTESTRR